MMERKAEIITFSVMSLGAFVGGIVFVFSTPPTVYDLIISVFYGVASAGAALQACDTYIEARKADEKWKQFINDTERNTPRAKNPMGLTMADIQSSSAKILRKKKRKKSGRRKSR